MTDHTLVALLLASAFAVGLGMVALTEIDRWIAERRRKRRRGGFVR